MFILHTWPDDRLYNCCQIKMVNLLFRIKSLTHDNFVYKPRRQKSCASVENVERKRLFIVNSRKTETVKYVRLLSFKKSVPLCCIAFSLKQHVNHTNSLILKAAAQISSAAQ